MVDSISKSALLTSLNTSYQRLQQAQARVEQSQREVSENRAALDRSNARLEKDKGSYADEMSRSRKFERSDLRYAVQSGSGTTQVKSAPEATNTLTVSAKVLAPAPVVNTNGQLVGGTVNTTA